VAEHPLPYAAVEGGLDGVAAGVGGAREAEGAGDAVDDFFPLIVWPLAHDGSEDFPKLLQAVVGHRGGSSADELAVGFDDLAADRGSQVAAQSFLDLGAEALVAQDDRNFLQER